MTPQEIITKIYELKVKGAKEFAEALDGLQANIAHTNKQLQELNKEEKKAGKLTEEQTAKRKELNESVINYNAQLKTLKTEIKNAEKTTAALNATNAKAEGYYNELNESVKSLTKQYKALSKEELEGAKGKEILTKLQAQKKELKELDASMGNYQRNVGNYKSATEALGSAFTKVAGVVGGVVVVFKGFEAVMNSTNMRGDQLAMTIEKGRAATDLFMRSLMTEGLDFFARNLRNVVKAAEEYKNALDQATEVNYSIRLIEAQNTEELARLQIEMRDVTKSYEERNKAAERYIELAQETYKLRAESAQYLNETAADAFFSSIKYKGDKATADAYLTEYARLSQEMRDELDRLKEVFAHRKKNFLDVSTWSGDVNNAARAELEELKRTNAEFYNLAEFWYKYDLSSGEAIDNYIESLIAAREAQGAFFESERRVLTTVNSIQSQLNKEENAVTVPIGVGDPAIAAALAEEEISEVVQKINIDLAKDNSSVGQIGVPIVPLVDATTNIAELLSQHTFGELMGDNLWVQLLGLGDTYYTEELNERLKGYTDQLKEGLAEMGGEVWGAYLSAREEAIDREMELEKKKNDARAESEKKALEGRFEQGKISEKKYAKELERIDEQRAAKEEALERAAFNRKKRLNVADALMKGALAILDVWKSFAGDPISRAIQLALTAAGTGVQVAAIQNQKFAQGGRIVGASHSAGGVKGWLAGQNIELEGGEVVINKRSAALFGEQLSAINAYRGYGKKFARGGVLGSEKYMPAPVPAGVGGGGISAADLAQIIGATVDNRISTLRVVVAEGDITSAQNNVKRAEVAATF